MANYQPRGVAASPPTADALRTLITQVGDWEAARRLGHTRMTIARVAARLPVNATTLHDVEARLAVAEADQIARR
jgi:hypothetical protein